MTLAHPKPTRLERLLLKQRAKQERTAERKRFAIKPTSPNRRKTTERGLLVAELDRRCAELVKQHAMGRCECCGQRPSEVDPLTTAHGDGRAQVWALRWAHSNLFALLWSCHRRFEGDRVAFLTFRQAIVSAVAWIRVQELERTRPLVGVEEMKLIKMSLKVGRYRQGER